MRDTIEVGDQIGVSPRPNSHGCMAYAILEYVGNGLAQVVEREVCPTCGDSVSEEEGTVQSLQGYYLLPPSDDWAMSTTWELYQLLSPILFTPAIYKRERDRLAHDGAILFENPEYITYSKRILQ